MGVAWCGSTAVVQQEGVYGEPLRLLGHLDGRFEALGANAGGGDDGGNEMRLLLKWTDQTPNPTKGVELRRKAGGKCSDQWGTRTQCGHR